jgi:hypothetical protein
LFVFTPILLVGTSVVLVFAQISSLAAPVEVRKEAPATVPGVGFINSVVQSSEVLHRKS